MQRSFEAKNKSLNNYKIRIIIRSVGDVTRMTDAESKLEKIKIAVYGEEDVGKTTLVHQFNPDQAKSIEHTTRSGQNITVGFDIGKITFGGYHLYFFGTPGQTRFEFARHIVAKGAHVGILLIDSEAATRRGINEREQEMEQEMIDKGLPYIICANKRDLDHVLPLHKINDHFKGTVLPISAKTGLGIDCLQNTLLEILDARKDERFLANDDNENADSDLAYG